MFPTSTAFSGSIREQRRDATEASTTSKKVGKSWENMNTWAAFQLVASVCMFSWATFQIAARSSIEGFLIENMPSSLPLHPGCRLR
jgi:hypothetical protein